MLSEGKISADEAERLLDAIENQPGVPLDDTSDTNCKLKRKPKWLRVQMESESGSDEPNEKVNIRVPLMLLKAGLKLGSMLPEGARAKIQSEYAGQGINFNFSDLHGMDTSEIVNHLSDININVESGSSNVRVYCE